MHYGINSKKAVKMIQNAFMNSNAEISDEDATLVYEIACERTKDETHQAMEALVHNLNTLHSRAGRMCA